MMVYWHIEVLGLIGSSQPNLWTDRWQQNLTLFAKISVPKEGNHKGYLYIETVVSEGRHVYPN